MEKIKTPILLYFANLIEKETGIIYSQENSYQLENRLLEICKALEIETLENLFKLAQDGGIQGMKKQFLMDVATNNETSFFRDSKTFKAFEKFMVPEWLCKKKEGQQLRIWSVASSFGQEPYSLSMLVQEMVESGMKLNSAEILCTDISDRALKRVKNATYSHLEIQRGLPANLMVKYFEKTSDDSWKVKSEITQRVTSQPMNLLNIYGIRGLYDIVFCRNVLIYQNEEKKKEIIENLSAFIPSGGYFIMGAAESLFGLSDKFNQVSYESAIFYQRK